MSANQAMSSARRRRGAPPQTTFPFQTAGTRRPDGGQGPQTKQPNPSNEKIQPLALVVQHDRRLWELEQQVPLAFDAVNDNIEVLREGLNALIEEGEEKGNNVGLSGDKLLQTKVDTALAEALTSKTLAGSATNAIESFRVNEIRELQAANEELKSELADLRQLVESIAGNDDGARASGVQEVSLSLEQ